LPDNRNRPASSIILAVALGLLYWILDGCLTAILNEEVDFIDAIFAPEPVWIYRRLMVLGLLTIAAIYLQIRIFKGLNASDKGKHPAKSDHPHKR